MRSFALSLRRLVALGLSVVAPGCGQALVEECDVDPPSPEDFGSVVVDQLPPGGAVNGEQPTELWASFHRDYVAPCAEVHRAGSCAVLRCERAWADGGELLDGGAITMTGGLTDLSLEGDALGALYHQKQDTPMFEPGDALTFSIAGSDAVEPFTTTLVAPPLPVITSGPPKLDRSTPSVFEWTSDPGEGRLAVSITNYPESVQTGDLVESGPVSERIACEADISEGSLTVPASLLEQLTPGAVAPTDVQISVWNRETRERDAFRLLIMAGGYATLPEGGLYWYSIPLE